METKNIIITNAEKLILEKLQSLERKLDSIIEEKAYQSIEEISLHRAERLLRMGRAKIIREVEKGNLVAIPFKDKNHKKRYRFRIQDIIEFQNKRSTKRNYEVEPAENICKRIFGIE